VIVRGLNDGDVVDLARLALDHDWTVRFIELMPLGTGAEAQVALDRFVSNHEVRAAIEAELGPLQELPNADPSDEARNFTLPAAPGRIGFISPVSDPYCGNCNRMRLTADGRFHLCLLHDVEIDVRALLRGGAPRESVREALQEAVRVKPVGHALARGEHTLTRRMHAIGG
jgi:cyclic pyranopterin phosphate synthase